MCGKLQAEPEDEAHPAAASSPAAPGGTACRRGTEQAGLRRDPGALFCRPARRLRRAHAESPQGAGGRKRAFRNSEKSRGLPRLAPGQPDEPPKRRPLLPPPPPPYVPPRRKTVALPRQARGAPPAAQLAKADVIPQPSNRCFLFSRPAVAHAPCTDTPPEKEVGQPPQRLLLPPFLAGAARRRDPPPRGADSSGFLGTGRRTPALPGKRRGPYKGRFQSREAPAGSFAQGKARRQAAKPPSSGPSLLLRSLRGWPLTFAALWETHRIRNATFKLLSAFQSNGVCFWAEGGHHRQIQNIPFLSLQRRFLENRNRETGSSSAFLQGYIFHTVKKLHFSP